MFNRLKYDTCATKSDVRDNVSIFSHTVDVNRFVRADPMYAERGVLSGNTTSTVGNQPTPGKVHEAWEKMVALENDLRGQTKTSSKCAAMKYIPEKGIARDKSGRSTGGDVATAPRANLATFEFVDYANLEEAYKG